MITGIVVALPEEISTLTAKKIAKGCCVFIDDTKIIAYSGTGPDNAKQAAERLITEGAQQLISWGCAAALEASLKPGSLVLANQLISADLLLFEADTNWLSFCEKRLHPTQHIYTGKLAESTALVASSNEKKQLHAKTDAIAVDMESLAVAKIAKQHQLPFIAIRAIADPVEMNLPNAISAALNEQGDIELSKLLLFLITHPTELPSLIKLGLHFQAAKNTLKQVATHLNAIADFRRSSSTF